VNDGFCPICGGPVTNETSVGHINTGLQPHHHQLKAFCEACQIVLERMIAGRRDTGWLSSSVSEQDVIGDLSEEEVAQVENLLGNYPALLRQWHEFIGQKRATDVVCRFKEQDSPYTGLTLKRANYLIGRFSVSRNL